MTPVLTDKDVKDGMRISELFATLSEENKTIAIVYLSALRDKEVADSFKEQEAADGRDDLQRSGNGCFVKDE